MLLTVWINAFIPKEVPNYTQRITKGKHSGKTAVPLPSVARFDPRNTGKNWNTGYLTDQRGFSDLPEASVRMQSLAKIEIRSDGIRLFGTPDYRTSGTTEVDIKEGCTLDSKKANMSRCRFSLNPVSGIRCTSLREAIWSNIFIPSGIIRMLKEQEGIAATAVPLSDYTLYVEGAASDPLVSSAADINYVGKFEVKKVLNNTFLVGFSGCIDDFPAFECYAKLGGKTKPLFTSSPPLGNTVVSLIGDASRRVSGVVSFP